MNTKPLPAILALIAGFVTCIISFVQGVDVTVFAKRFIIVCLVFFVLGVIISIVIHMNFKEMDTDGEFESLDDLDLESDEEFEQEAETDSDSLFEETVDDSDA